MWTSFVEFLKAWKARLIALGTTILGLIDVIEPDWVVNIVGPNNKGWVYIALVGGAFLLHQLIPDSKQEKD